ncbi:MAG: UbiA family prenyltransferase, partial [Pseudomonadota bacterium]
MATQATQLPSSDGAPIAEFATAKDYLDLMKPRIMLLVVFTGIAGLVAAPGALHPVMAIVSVLAIAMGSGAAGALNMWYDADIDQVMSRTSTRPIP